MHNTQQQLLQLCGAAPSPRRAHSTAAQPDGLAAHAAAPQLLLQKVFPSRFSSACLLGSMNNNLRVAASFAKHKTINWEL